MPYYAGASGDVFRCVLADDHIRAALYAVAAHLNDADEECRIGPFFVVAEHNVPSGKHMVIPSSVVEEMILAGGENDSVQ